MSKSIKLDTYLDETIRLTQESFQEIIQDLVSKDLSIDPGNQCSMPAGDPVLSSSSNLGKNKSASNYSFKISKYSLAKASGLFNANNSNAFNQDYLLTMTVTHKTLKPHTSSTSHSSQDATFSVSWTQMINRIKNGENFNGNVIVYLSDIIKNLEILSNQVWKQCSNGAREGHTRSEQSQQNQPHLPKLQKLFALNNILYDFFQYDKSLYESLINLVVLFGQIAMKRSSMLTVAQFVDWLSNYIDLLKERKNRTDIILLDFSSDENSNRQHSDPAKADLANCERSIISQYKHFEEEYGCDFIQAYINNDLVKMLKNSRLVQMFQLSFLFQLFQVLYILFGFHKLSKEVAQFETGKDGKFSRYELEQLYAATLDPTKSVLPRPRLDHEIQVEILKFYNQFPNLLSILSNDFMMLAFPGVACTKFRSSLSPLRIEPSNSQRYLYLLIAGFYDSQLD